MNHISRRTALSLLGSNFLPVSARAGGISVSNIDIMTEGGRVCQVTHWRPPAVRGKVLFSHGAFSTPWAYAPLILPWATAGFEIYAPLHVDSIGYPDSKAYPGLASWQARIEDMRALSEHVGGRGWVAAGHSYGALVALTLGGATPMRPAGIEGPLSDPRATAVVAFSPPGPGMGLVGDASYATLAVPALIETGTKDVPYGVKYPDGWRAHLTAYEDAPPGGARYALVLDSANHYFGGLICRSDVPGPHQMPQLAKAVRYSVMFLDGYAAGDGAARQTLANKASDAAPWKPGLYRR